MSAGGQQQLRPQPPKSTGTHQNSEVKPVRGCASTELRDHSGKPAVVIFGNFCSAWLLRKERSAQHGVLGY